MKIQLPKEDWKTWVPPTPISYKSNATMGKIPIDKSDYLKVNIKTQPGERYSETVVIYMPLSRAGIPESLLKFVTILHKIIRGQYLSMGPQKFGMVRNLVVIEALRVF